MPCIPGDDLNSIAGELSGVALMPKKPSVLMHACCGPCSTSCVERTAEDYALTMYYYNPNITDREEYYLRRDTLLQFLRAFNEEHRDFYTVGYLEGAYEPERFIEKTYPLADEPEGGRRCDICFALRLSETARMARELGMEYFTTTMSVKLLASEVGFEDTSYFNRIFRKYVGQSPQMYRQGNGLSILSNQ